MKSSSLGELEMMVLLAVLRLGDEAYGTAIMEEIERRTRRDVARGSVYVTLDRLEQKELVTSRLGDPSPVRGGRAKRFFRMRPAGVRALKQTLADLGSMQEGLEPLLSRS